MLIDAAYLTTRDDGRVEWFMDSLARELESLGASRPETRLVVVDSRLWYVDERERRERFREASRGRFGDFVHVPPKPSVWQGPTRLTTFDLFCAASARNTALCHARGSHVVFADDLSVLMPGWASGHLHAAIGGYVLCGYTNKNKEVVVEDGQVVSMKLFPPGQDHRLRGVPRDGAVRCAGSWLHGGTFSVPLEAALAVNGQDEACDTIGGEDYDFGIRLERARYPVYFNRTCGTVESEEAHHTEPHTTCLRIDKKLPPDVARNVPGDGASSTLLYHRLVHSTSSWTQGRQPVLRELRERVLAGDPFPVPTEPTRHWVDGQPLSKIKPTHDGYDDAERSGVRDW